MAVLVLRFIDGRFSDVLLAIGSETGINDRDWAGQRSVIEERHGSPMDQECGPTNIYYCRCKRFEVWTFGC